ncbi:MAG TPA: response regulator [Thermoanaerobaculia bacterium]|nr:response regulator [Thermoanaerobaculia bacterium]
MKPLNILIVDDQPINLKLLKAQLEAEGHAVLEAANGAEALAVLDRREVDVIVSDILMPVMDGYRLCYEVRRREGLRELPFIIYTSSYVSPSDEKLSLDLGADRYLRKPASSAVLMRAIEEAISSPRHQPATALDATDVLKEYSERLVTKLEKKNTELLAAVSQLSLLGTALETTADAAIITDAAGVILWVNTAFTTTTGYTAEEAIGKTPRILKSGLQSEEFYREFWKTIRDGQPWLGEFANRRKDGTIYYDAHTVTPVRGADGSITHFVGVMHDVTERKRAEELLRESELAVRRQNEYLAALHETAVGLMNRLDLSELLLAIANRCAAITETQHVFVGIVDENDSDRLIPAGGTGVFATMRPQMHRGEGLVGQVWDRGLTMSVSDVATWPDRKRDLPVDLHASFAVPVRSGSKVTGVIGVADLNKDRQFSPEQIEIVERFAQLASVALDNARLYGEARREIAERQKAEAEVRELNSQLEDRVEERTRQLASVNHELELRTNELAAANVELSAASSLKDEFLANMSHELRTPLNAILGMSEVLEEGIHGALNNRQRKSLKTIEESGRHLLELINDILDLSKIEAGKLELTIAPVGVRALCEASVRMVRELAVKKGIRLSTSIDPALVTLSGDDRRLKQILVNLLSNAVKFTPEGGAVGLDVTGSAEQNIASFSVWDTGIGISAPGIDQLFRPFVQLDSTYARQFAGTGLGLSLVRRMTQLHGGRVDVESAVGQGSRFTVTIPWRQPIEIAQTPTQPQSRSKLESDRLTALVIEDDDATAEQLTRYLLTIGFADVVHDSGAHALSLAAEHNPAVVILDIMLDGESGWNILGEMKSRAQTRHIPVIVASVVDDEPRGRALGAADYVVKPVSYDNLAVAVGRVVPSVRDLEKTRGPRKSGVILLAEDNPSNIEVMRDFIDSRGYAMVVAADGFEAVERAVECHPAMIFMDIQMPRLDGFEAIRRIRKHSLLEKTPIVALTAFAMGGDREKCLAAGADDYMTKPVSLKTLTEVLQRFLST